jgi:ABC-type glutathione transport system ATPase component
MSGRQPPILEVRALTIHYGPHRVVDSFDLTLCSGETVGLLGESGSGKTTIALALLALLGGKARVTGEVLLEGTNLLALPEGELENVRGRRIAMIFQEPSAALNPVMTAGDHICEVLRAHRRYRREEAIRVAVSLLREVRFEEPRQIFKTYPHELSGGQQQRVLIAQALACSPRILIADEPSSALDTITQAEILELLKDLRTRHQIAMLFITHDPTILAGFADRLVVVHEGKKVEEGTFDEVCERPVHPFTRQLLSSSLLVTPNLPDADVLTRNGR